MNQALFLALEIALISTTCIVLLVTIVMYLLRHKVKAFDKFLNSLVSKNNKQPMTCNPEALKEMIRLAKQLPLQDRLILIQALTQRDIKVLVGIDDTSFWIEGISGVNYETKL